VKNHCPFGIILNFAERTVVHVLVNRYRRDLLAWVRMPGVSV
jgi:hypothetical protein